MDRLIGTSEVGTILGGLHQNDVRQLIHDGRLKAVRRVVRGKNKVPRLFVLASELERFMRALPAVGEVAPAKPKRRALTDVRAELAECKQYV